MEQGDPGRQHQSGVIDATLGEIFRNARSANASRRPLWVGQGRRSGTTHSLPQYLTKQTLLRWADGLLGAGH
jgi:hypothetical protein